MSEAARPKRALVAWGGWPGHEPEQGAAIVAAMLREAGFEVAVEPGTAAFADKGLRDLDLIVPILTMSTNPSPLMSIA